MASVKNLKKDINYIIGDIIEECYTWQLLNPSVDSEKAALIVDEAIAVFDSLIEKVNTKKVDNFKSHFKSINTELEQKAAGLLEKINNL